MWDDYGDPGVLEKSDGGPVLHSDHARKVTRIQRARARNLVGTLRNRANMCTVAVEGGRVVVFSKIHDCDQWCTITIQHATRCYSRASRIENAYLR